jgi:membrane-bound ClpP family serine protease
MRTTTPIVARFLVGALLLGALTTAPVRADGPVSGLVVPMPADRIPALVKDLPRFLDKPLRALEEAADARQAAEFRLVLDCNPEGRPNRCADSGACRDLARRIRDAQNRGARTVAWVHGEVSRHSVLPVLACDEIVLSDDPPSRLGPVLEGNDTLDADERLSYELIARNRYPLALVRKLYEPGLAVVRVQPWVKDGDRYRDRKDMKPGDFEAIAALAAGRVAAYGAEEARAFGLAQKAPMNALDDLLAAYRLPRESLLRLPEQPIVWRLVLSGEVNGGLRERTARQIKRALGQKANVLILQLECRDGDSEVANEMARELLRLNEGRATQVEIIAYVTPQAANTATFLALACDRIVMQPEARLGNWERYMQGHPSLEGAIRQNLAEVAAAQHYPEAIARAFVDHDLVVHRAVSDRGEHRFLDQAELDRRNRVPDGPRWRSEEVVKPPRNGDAHAYLTLDAQAAKRLGLATVADGLAPVYQELNVNEADVHLVKADFLDRLGEFLRDEWTRAVLIMVGLACLILEMKMPGATLPGILAAVCFVLFFWSHSQLNEQMTVLALCLFVLGVVLIGVEVFVLPGMGVCGLSGIVLVLGSLGLVAYGHWPQSSSDWAGYGRALSPIGLGMLGAVVLAVLLAKYLPQIPLANRLVLRPPGEVDETTEGPAAPAEHDGPDLASLLGAIGVAATPLRPAGKTRFGDEFVDVVAEGGYIQPGTRVQVIEIEGNRVVVKEV